MIFTVNGKQILFIINHLVCLGDTKDPLCLSLSVASHHFSHKIERPWCRTFTRPLLLNHRADSPHKPTAAIPVSSAITAAPSTDKSDVSVPSSCRGSLERVATPRHPPAAPCTFGRGCPSSCCAHQPRALFCRAFPLNSVSRNPRLHCRGPTPSTRPLGNYPHLSLRLPLPPCHRTNFHKHITINGGLVCLYLCLSCLDLCLILICFVLFDYLCFDLMMLICWWS